MKRRISIAFAIVSFLFALGIIAEWALSYRYVDCLYYTIDRVVSPPANLYEHTTSMGWVSVRGTLELDWFEDVQIQKQSTWFDPGEKKFTASSGPWTWGHAAIPSLVLVFIDVLSDGQCITPREAGHSFALIGYDHQIFPPSSGVTAPGLSRLPGYPVPAIRFVTMPYAYGVGLFLVFPAIFGSIELHRQLRRLSGHCLNCGYDIQATPGRCPECGQSAVA